MKKAFKILSIVLIVLVALVGAGSLLLKSLLPPETVKKKLLAQLTGKLNREVQMGPVAVGLLSGLHVSDLKVSESPDFTKGTFLTSKHFSIKVSLIPLLFRKVVVRQIQLDAPEVTIVRYADGKTFNFTSLTSPVVANSTTTSSSMARSSEPPFLLLVSKAEVRKGIIHFIDQSPADQSIEVNPLNVKLGNVSLVSPFSVQGDLRANRKGMELGIEVVGEVDLKAGTFKFKKGQVLSGKSAVNLSGKVVDIRSENPQADLRLQMKDFNLEALGPLLRLPAGTQLKGPMSGSGHLKGHKDRAELGLNLDLSKALVVYGTLLNKPAKVPMSLSLQSQVQHFQDADVQAFGLALGSLKVTARGRIQGLTSALPSSQLHIETNAFPAEEVFQWVSLGLPPEVKMKGLLQGSVDFSGTSASSQINFKLNATDAQVAYGNQFQKPAGTSFKLGGSAERLQSAASKESSLEARQLQLTLGTLEFSGTGSYRQSKGVGQIALNGKTNSFSLQGLSPMVPSLTAYKPTGNAVIDLKASGSTAAPAVQGTVQLDRVGLQYEKSDLSQVVGTIRFTQQDVVAPQLKGKLNGSDFSVALQGRKLQTAPDIAVDGTLAALDLEKILPTPVTPKQAFQWIPLAYAAPAAALPMKVNAHLAIGKLKHELYQGQDFDFRCDLTNVTPDLSRVSGTAALRQGQGRVQKIEKLAAISRTARIALMPLLTLQKIDSQGLLKKLGLPSLDDIPFDSITGDYSMKAGVMNVQVFELAGKTLGLSTLGTIALAGDQELDLKAAMKLPPGTIGGTLGQIFGDVSGQSVFKFSIKGPVQAPVVKPDMQEALDKGLNKLGDVLKGFGLGGGSR